MMTPTNRKEESQILKISLNQTILLRREYAKQT